MKNRRHSYGWKPDQTDQRDYAFTPSLLAGALPAKVDLRADAGLVRIPILNQGKVSSCTAEALAVSLGFAMGKNFEADLAASPMFIYYLERYLEGDVYADQGAQIRTGAKVLSRYGACLEKTWPFLPSKLYTKPSQQAFTEALTNRATEYRRVNNDLDSVRSALAEGFPVVFGFIVYPSFESDQVKKTGKAVMPRRGERPLGGHAVLAVGYDDQAACLIVRNSWGATWGDAGHFYLPYGFVGQPQLSADYWVIKRCL